MKCHIRRLGILMGLLTTPLVALAQEETSAPPRPGRDMRHGPETWLAALNLGLHGHSLDLNTRRGEIPVVMASLEHHLLPHFTAFVGPHLGMGFNASGFQFGSRIFFSEQSFHGFFLSAQASFTFVEVDSNTDATRKSLGGLVGYAHPLGNRWLVSFSAGAQSTRTRTETISPPNLCIFWCGQGSDIQDKVEHTEAVEPVLQMATTFRF